MGGLLKDDHRLSPTSEPMVSSSDVMIGIGGGEVTRDEMVSAKKTGKTIQFIPADMNHKKAIERAKKRNQPVPTDFRGAAHEAFGRNSGGAKE